VYNTVIIRPSVDAVTVSGTTVGGRGLIELNGADNVVIDGDNPNTAGTNRDLTLQNTAAATTTFTSVYRIALNTTTVTSANGNNVINTHILGSAVGRNIAAATSQTGSEFTTFGILVGGGATGATTAPSAITSVATTIGAPATATGFTVTNNRIDACARGIAVQGAAITVANLLTVSNNTIGSATPANTTTVYARGMTLQGFNNATISGNTLQNLEYFVNTQMGGIWLGDGGTTGTNATVENNVITGVFNQNTVTFGAYGINVNAGNSITVRNNFISNVRHSMTGGAAFSTTFGVFGIRVSLGTGHRVYHNSVNLFGTLPGTANSSLLSAAFAIVGAGQTGMDVRNNAFANNISGGTTSVAHVSVYLPAGATSAMNLTLSNNGYYSGTDAARQGLAQAGTTAGTNFFLASNFNPALTFPASNFRAYSSTLSPAGTNDSASFATTAAVPFTSGTDLHVPNGTTTLLESRGADAAATGVFVDIDGEPRPNGISPDSGADEFTGTGAPANDIASAAITSPAPGSIMPPGAGVSPQAVFHNAGAATQVGVSVTFDITGPGGYAYSDTQVITLTAGQALNVLFAAATPPTAVGTYNMTSTVATPDANPANDQVIGSFDVQPPVAGGSHTVPGDYPSLTNTGGIFQILNAVGASGDVTIEIAADLAGETGAHPLNQLAGGFNVTIKPTGAPRTISGTTTGNTGLIKLNGADGVTIDGSLAGGTDRSLTITTGNASGVVLWIGSLAGNGATNNTVKNCIISGSTGVTPIAGIIAGSGTVFGGAAEAANSNNTIQNNEIFRVQNSAFLSGVAGVLDQNWLITGNTFGSTVAADKNRFRGMLLGNAGNYVISNNIIRGVVSLPTVTSTMSGIQISATQNTGSIFGNQISDIKQTNTGGFGANGIFSTATSTASNVSIFNNFIWDVAGFGFAGVGQADNGYGIMLNAGGGYHLSYNTVFMGTNQTLAGSITAAINIASGVTTANSINLRDNIFINAQTVGTRYAIYDAVALPAGAAIFATIDFNDYFSSQNVGFLGGARPTLADWQAATGKDVASQAVDPLLVSPTDLHLQATSPLLGDGTPIPGITTDIDGDLRSPTAPEIGADELLKADLATTKLDGPDPVVAGNNLTYTITVSNAGPVNATSVSLSDPLPAGTTFVSVTPPSGWGCTAPPVGSGGTVTCTNPVVGLGDHIFDLVVRVDRSVPAGTVITNTATVTAATADPNLGNESGVATTTVDAAADLAVTKADSPDPVTIGNNITYTITVDNIGPSNAASATLTDPIPAGTTFASLAPPAGWTCSTPLPDAGAGAVVSCSNASMAPGQAVFVLKVKVGLAVPPGSIITNTATAAAATADPNPGNESGTATTTVGAAADIAVGMTVDDDTPGAGQNVTFTVTVTNAGPSNATVVRVTDLLPVRLTFVSATPSQGTYTSSTGVWDVGAVANGGTAILALVATATTTDTLVNHATKTGQGEADPNGSNNTALVDLNGVSPADIQVLKTVDNNTPAMGTNVTFRVTVANGGPEDTTGVEITDQLPTGLDFVSATPSQGTYTSATGIWNLGAVDAGQTETLDIVATVSAAGAITNTALKTDQDAFDYVTSNDWSSVTLNDDTSADLALNLTASHEPVAVGTPFTYQISVVNLGPASATGVTVTDDLPSGLVLLSATPSQGNCTGTTSVVCDLGSLGSGISAQVALLVLKETGGDVSNTASVAGDQNDPNLTNNSKSTTTTPVEVMTFEVE
jgi:uncharacterized repeat protein (TIGR01451 family)